MIKNTTSQSSIFQLALATTIRGAIMFVFYLSSTPLYPLYVLSNIVGIFCNQKSIVALLCLIVFLLALLISLLVYVVLNLSITRERIGRLIGVSFLEEHLPGRPRGLVPCGLFFLTPFALDFVETFSLLSRVHEHNDSLQLINQEIKKISTDRPVPEALESFYKALAMADSMPYKCYPTEGILTDIASYLCFF